LAPKPLEGLSILLVEDAVDNQLLVSRFLKLAGAQVTDANNGKEGVDAARAGGIDLVLMDIQMPVMNGIQAMRAVRLEGFAQPIIALTAHAMKEDREGCLELGFDDHVTKPIDRGSLIQRIVYFCKTAKAPGAAAAAYEARV
jgi:CheY-like chemotaxis protein